MLLCFRGGTCDLPVSITARVQLALRENRALLCALRETGTIMRVHHRSIFLVIVQAWIVPCHGFAYTPHSLGSVGLASSPTARHASFAGPLPCPPTAGDRGTLSSLSMSDQEGGPFDPYGDEVCKAYDCTVASEYLLHHLWYALLYTARAS